MPFTISKQHFFSFIIFSCSILSIDRLSHADYVDDLISQAIELNLADHPTWLKLLHFNPKNGMSDVISSDFFIATDGNSNPQAELVATLESFFYHDDNTRCVFPARYYWLNQHLKFENMAEGLGSCSKLKNWSIKNKIKSLSLYFVSGYFGNPASTFGHALLKFNSENQSSIFQMFDTAVSFGAIVPDHENPIVYIAKGIFGGYDAVFSDKYYFTQDLVYSKTEHRDVWDYELNLSDDQRNLIILHNWEILGKKFQYFFLNKNCAYRLAKLIELVIDEPLSNHARIWYAPIELFQNLESIDRTRRVQGKTPLIKKIVDIPSSRRKLYQEFKKLSPKEFDMTNAIINKGLTKHSEELNLHTQQEQQNILDASLNYLQYKIMSNKPKIVPKLEQSKKNILLARLKRPARPSNKEQLEAKTSPAKGHKPISSSLGYHRTKHRHRLQLSISPYDQSVIGLNGLDGGAITVAHTTFHLHHQERPVLYHFKLIDIKKNDTTHLKIGQESHWSWALDLSSQYLYHSNESSYDHQFHFSYGKAWRLKKHIITSLRWECSAHSVYPHLRMAPKASTIFHFGGFRSSFDLKVENEDSRHHFREKWLFQTQKSIDKQTAIQLTVEKARDHNFSLSLVTYW